jgi:DNA-binding transcriptional ArsR family regulator
MTITPNAKFLGGSMSLNLPGIKQQDGGVEKVDVPKTRRDLADYLGLTIETVSQTLTKLKQDGLIALAAATRIEIRDRDQLEELTADEIQHERLNKCKRLNENGNGRKPAHVGLRPPTARRMRQEQQGWKRLH